MIRHLWHALFGHKYKPWYSRPAVDDAVRLCSCGSYQLVDLAVKGTRSGHPMNEY